MRPSTCRTAVFACISYCACISMATEPPSSPPELASLQVSGIDVADILEFLGARLEHGATTANLRVYAVQFDRTDLNGDGKHSRSEYIDGGRYLTPQARSGIFRAADGNHDGQVTRSEYILNRIITDEAKEILEARDENRNRQIERAEFLTLTAQRITDADLAEAIFAALDTNRDGRLLTPEYLRIWGQWARAGQPSAEERIAARQATLARGPNVPLTNNARTRGRPTGRPMPPDIDEVFRRFDANKDNALAIDEVPPFVQQFVFPADANRDDKVTITELKAFRAARPDGSPSRNLQEDRRNPSTRRGPPAAGDTEFPRRRGARRRPPNPDQFVQQALQFDRNGDGELDRQELLNFARNMTRQRGNGRFQRRPSNGFPNRDIPRRLPPERERPDSGNRENGRP
ncbi:MAG: hypothetical protein VX346_27245 [Planctomycetota bacterium]|nr:hypothetical protein [Planctomycetota bacterium]